MALFRFIAHIDEILAHGPDTVLAGDRTMARHDRFDIHRQDSIAGIDPVADRAFPHDRVTFDEQDVAGEDRLVGRHIDQRVARCVRGADMHDTNLLGADMPGQFCFEGGGGQCLRHALEVEGAEALRYIFSEIAETRRHVEKAG